MRIRQVVRASTVVAALLACAGCDRGSDQRDGISTEVNLSDDAAANDVLGGNEAATNEASASEAA